jgi:hypothetical protein
LRRFGRVNFDQADFDLSLADGRRERVAVGDRDHLPVQGRTIRGHTRAKPHDRRSRPTPSEFGCSTHGFRLSHSICRTTARRIIESHGPVVADGQLDGHTGQHDSRVYVFRPAGIRLPSA